MKKAAYLKLYKKIKAKHPDVKNEHRMDALMRRAIFKRNLIVVLLLYLLSIASFILLANLGVFINDPKSDPYQEAAAALKLLGGGGAVLSTIVFARSLHDPLTPAEAEELLEKEAREKTGQK